ncbi:hypothetical protein HYS94_03650 [Candidatus Daviesbacteria bacterium]|nr:hypothetical protein [Candidatus Daviesbacteria bacterium]
MSALNRNVTIVVIILVLVVIAGYLVWLRSKYQPPVSPVVEETVTVSPIPTPTEIATPSASPTEEATGSMKQKTSTPSSTSR